MDSTINDNVANQQGVCIRAIESDPVGGGVYTDNGAVVATNATFTDNHAELAGGGFAAVGSTTVSGSTFTNNTVGVSGEAGGFDEFAAQASDPRHRHGRLRLRSTATLRRRRGLV